MQEGQKMSDKGIVTVTIDDVPPSNNKFMGIGEKEVILDTRKRKE